MKRAWFILIIAMIIITISIKPIKIAGNSMSPTYSDGDTVLLYRLSYLISGPKRGDVVVFKQGSDMLIKRIVAIPKDFVTIDDKGYVMCTSDSEDGRWVPNDKYFIIGDNINNSIDSRYETIKYIDEKDILGKIIYKW